MNYRDERLQDLLSAQAYCACRQHHQKVLHPIESVIKRVAERIQGVKLPGRETKSLWPFFIGKKGSLVEYLRIEKLEQPENSEARDIDAIKMGPSAILNKQWLEYSFRDVYQVSVGGILHQL